MVFRYNEVYNTGSATSECFYVGCQDSGCIFSNGLFEFNYCHDTMSATAGYGSGIQVKTGSYSNILRNNVFRNTKGPGILMYDDYNRGINTVEGNYIYTTSDNGIQVTAGARVINNIVINAAANGIRGQNNQVMPGSQVRNLFFAFNTVVLRTSTSPALRVDTSSLGSTITISNNAVWSYQGAAYSITSGATINNNGYYGGSAVGTASVALRDVATEVLNPTAENWYPSTTSRLISAGSRQGLSSAVTQDFNCLSRSQTPTIGAYEKSSNTNPNPWNLSQGGFKQGNCVAQIRSTTSRV